MSFLDSLFPTFQDKNPDFRAIFNAYEETARVAFGSQLSIYGTVPNMTPEWASMMKDMFADFKAKVHSWVLFNVGVYYAEDSMNAYWDRFMAAYDANVDKTNGAFLVEPGPVWHTLEDFANQIQALAGTHEVDSGNGVEAIPSFDWGDIKDGFKNIAVDAYNQLSDAAKHVLDSATPYLNRALLYIGLIVAGGIALYMVFEKEINS